MGAFSVQVGQKLARKRTLYRLVDFGQEPYQGRCALQSLPCRSSSSYPVCLLHHPLRPRGALHRNPASPMAYLSQMRNEKMNVRTAYLVALWSRIDRPIVWWVAWCASFAYGAYGDSVVENGYGALFAWYLLQGTLTCLYARSWCRKEEAFPSLIITLLMAGGYGVLGALHISMFPSLGDSVFTLLFVIFSFFFIMSIFLYSLRYSYVYKLRIL